MKQFLKILGPGLLYAGAAVGVSHLVQSTRAGAMFNFEFVWILIVANFLKYPFFDFGVRYATATGNNLIDGYKKTGKWAVVLYAFITVVSMFIIQAAVTIVAVSLFAFIFKVTIDLVTLSGYMLFISVVFLALGRYSFLDKLMKFIIILLSLSTIIAVFSALGIHKEVTPESLLHFKWTSKADIFFLIAFVGWMPAPIDVSIWSSIWNIEKYKELGYTPKLKDALTEFRFSYIFTAVLALGFLSLGALVMYGTGETFSASGVKFSGQLISMYTKSIGNWSYWIISIAAFTTMFSTVITVLDAYSRVLTPLAGYLVPGLFKGVDSKKSIWLWLGVMFAGTMVIIGFLVSSMRQMVDLATTLSFITTPAFAYINYKAVTDNHFPKEAQPGKFLKILSWIGMAFFVVFSIIYIVWRYFV